MNYTWNSEHLNGNENKTPDLREEEGEGLTKGAQFSVFSFTTGLELEEVAGERETGFSPNTLASESKLFPC